jgi:hypothetical protein
LGNHADLRRDFNWGNLNLDFFGVLVEVPRGGGEEGGDLVVFWGNLIEVLPCKGADGWTVDLKRVGKG